MDSCLDLKQAATLFYKACERGDANAVEELLLLVDDSSSNLDLNRVSLDGLTPLCVACSNGHAAVVRLLLRDPRVDPNRTDSRSWTPLSIASFGDHPTAVEVLLNDHRTDVAQVWNLMYLLMSNAPVSVVKLLLGDHRIDPNGAVVNDWTPLFLASFKGLVEIVDFLLSDPRVDPNQSDREGMTPLHVALIGERPVVIEHLLRDPRTDPTIACRCGWTPLHRACVNDSLPTVKILLANEKTFDLSRECRLPAIHGGGQTTALSMARTRQQPDIVEWLEKYQQNHVRVRQQLRHELGWITQSGQLLAHVVFVCDDLLRSGAEGKEEERARRFFKIAARLPLELQMVLANRSYGLATNLIPHRDRELAFRDLARVYRSIR